MDSKDGSFYYSHSNTSFDDGRVCSSKTTTINMAKVRLGPILYLYIIVVSQFNPFLTHFIISI